MNYVVTGSEGFLGRNITKRLLAEGHHVRGYDNLSRGHRTIEHENYEFIQESVLSSYLCFEDTDCVIHCAAVNGSASFYREPRRVLEVGVIGTVNVLKEAERAKVKEFIFFSSSEIYNDPDIIPTPETVTAKIPDPLNPRFSYAGSKMIGELMVFHMANFERTIIVRPHNVYSGDAPLGHVIPDLIQKVKTSDVVEIQGNGTETRSFCFIDDFIEAFHLILKKGVHREIYNIGSSEEICIETVAKTIGSLMGREIQIVRGMLREGSPIRRCPDIHKLSSLGFSQQTSLQEGLQKTITWYENNR